MKIFAVLIASLMLLDADADCPPNWIERPRRSCYFANPIQKASWADAETYCRTLGGYLAHIDSGLELSFMQGMFTQAQLWIGVTDLQEEGVWRSTLTGEPIDFYFEPWGSSEPDGGHNQNCVFLSKNTYYKWADGYCHELMHFICERSAN